MPPTIASSRRRSHVPYLIYEEEWTAVNAGEAVDLSWAAADGPAVLPYKVELEVLTPPTSRDVVHLQRTTATDSAANRTVRLAVDTTPGGDLAGARVLIRLWWLEQASGGITVAAV